MPLATSDLLLVSHFVLFSSRQKLRWDHRLWLQRPGWLIFRYPHYPNQSTGFAAFHQMGAAAVWGVPYLWG